MTTSGKEITESKTSQASLHRFQSWIWPGILASVALFFYATREILLPFLAGAFIAYILNPMTTFLARKIGRSAAALKSLVFFFAIFSVAVMGALPFIKTELLDLSQSLPAYIEKIYIYLKPWLRGLELPMDQHHFTTLDNTLQKNLSSIFSWGLKVLAGVFSNTLALANLLSLVVITPLVAFYLLRDWPLIIETLDQLLPRKVAPVMRDLLSRINNVLGNYARGQLLVCVILALYYATALKILGLNYAITIGLITGFFAFIPYVGFFIGVVAALGMALGQYEGWVEFGIIGAIFLLGQLLESYILLPKLIGDKVGLHPVWILFALLAGGLLFGFLGLLIAMPIAAAIGVIVRFAIGEYRKSHYITSHCKNDTEPLRKEKTSPASKCLSSKQKPEDPNA